MSGVANIFDVAVVFIVGLMIALFSVYRIGDLIDPNSEVTLVKTDADGLREIIVKRGTEITAYELTGETLGGRESAWARRIASPMVRSFTCRISRPLVVALLIGGCAVPAVAQDLRLAYLFSDGNLPGMLAAYKALLEERPDLRERVRVEFLTESLFDEVEAGALLETDVLVFDVMNQQLLERFNTTHGVDLIERISGQGLVLAVGEGLLPREQYVEQGAVWDDRARAFWANWGLANQLGLLKQVLSAAGVADLAVPDPQPSLDAGYYYPDGETGRVFATWDAFDGRVRRLASQGGQGSAWRHADCRRLLQIELLRRGYRAPRCGDRGD